MHAMVLAAGLGRRMLPLTLTMPKPMVPALGRPLVVQTLHWLADHGVRDAVLNLHCLPDAIRQGLGSGGPPGAPRLRYSVEPTLLGTGGGLARAADFLRGEGPVVVTNSDFVSDIDLRTVLDVHRRSGLPATWVLAPWREGYSRVWADRFGRIVRIGGFEEPDGEPTKARLFTGCHVLDEECLDRLDPSGPSCIVKTLYRPLAEEGLLGSYVHEGFWWELGTPGSYLAGSLRLLEDPCRARRILPAGFDAVRRGDAGVAAIGAGAEVSPCAHLRGRVALGYACHVGDGAVLEDSVVMPESWIGPDTKLRNVVIGPGVELPAGFSCEDHVICQDSIPDRDPPPPVERAGDLLTCPFSPVSPG